MPPHQRYSPHANLTFANAKAVIGSIQLKFSCFLRGSVDFVLKDTENKREAKLKDGSKNLHSTYSHAYSKLVKEPWESVNQLHNSKMKP